MFLINICLSVFIFFSALNVVSAKTNKFEVSAEKNDMLSLKFEDNILDIDSIAPKYFLNSKVDEIKIKGFSNKSFIKNFQELEKKIDNYLQNLHMELDKLDKNSQVFSSEYIFHRKNYIKNKIESISEALENMTIKDKRKLIVYIYTNSEIEKYDSILGFSIIYNSKENPFLVETIIMPDYIGKLESVIISKSIDLYKNQVKVKNEIIQTKPSNYFDRYFLNAVGFK